MDYSPGGHKELDMTEHTCMLVVRNIQYKGKQGIYPTLPMCWLLLLLLFSSEVKSKELGTGNRGHRHQPGEVEGSRREKLKLWLLLLLYGRQVFFQSVMEKMVRKGLQ